MHPVEEEPEVPVKTPETVSFVNYNMRRIANFTVIGGGDVVVTYTDDGRGLVREDQIVTYRKVEDRDTEHTWHGNCPIGAPCRGSL